MSNEPELDLLGAVLETSDGSEGTTPVEPALPQRQYCVFRAGRERYCLSVLQVEEVLDWPATTPVPLAPPYLVGVFNLRGVIVPVLDIAYGEVRGADQPVKKLVVAVARGTGNENDLRVGLACDDVVGTFVTTERLLVEEAPRDVAHCCGLFEHDGHLALALDVRRLAEAFPIPVI